MDSKILLALLLIPAFVSGCIQNTPPENNSQQLGLANPASSWCVEQNGTSEIRDSPGGQTGYCTLNNRTCEEWALYMSNGTVCEE